jgi:hypothetical protein
MVPPVFCLISSNAINEFYHNEPTSPDRCRIEVAPCDEFVKLCAPESGGLADLRHGACEALCKWNGAARRVLRVGSNRWDGLCWR